MKSKLNKSLSNSIPKNKIIKIIIEKLFGLIFKSIRELSIFLSKKGNSVCIISIHKLGDSIFTFDAVNSIKAFYQKDVYIVCSHYAKDIYTLIHPEEFVIPVPKDCFKFNDRYLTSKARKILSSLNPEVIIDLTGVMTSASLIFNSKARRIIGMNRKIFQAIFNDFQEVNTNLNSTEIYTNAIKNIIPITPLIVEKKQENNPVKKILVAPFAGWKSKEWGLGKFIRLIERLKTDYELEIVFDFTPISEELLNYLKENEIQFSKTKTISELIQKIKTSDMLIGNDSGPVHIAAFLGKKTFSIYGPTNPAYHLPKGEQNTFIQKNLPCSPKINERLCFTDGGKSGCPSFECLNQLSVDEVYNKIKTLLT